MSWTLSPSYPVNGLQGTAWKNEPILAKILERGMVDRSSDENITKPWYARLQESSLMTNDSLFDVRGRALGS